MTKDSLLDYVSYILFKLAGFLIRCLPKSAGLFLGRRIGDLVYLFDAKHRSVVRTNLKTAFGATCPVKKINSYTRSFYQAFGQNIIEIFFIPLVDKNYMNKYIHIEGKENIAKAFAKGKGAIFLAMHNGSWELSNIISANLGFPFSLLVGDGGRYFRLQKLLNLYRTKKGCKIIYRKNQTRAMIEALKNNEGIGMTVDQGGKTGCLVKFFGKNASMATGAIKLALRYDTAILPVFFTRVKGPYVRIFIEPPFEIRKNGEPEIEVQENLQRLIDIYAQYISCYPHEYLWIYKVWKYSDQRSALILSDDKAGHLRQSEGVVRIMGEALKEKNIALNLQTLEVKWRRNSKLLRHFLALGCFFAGRYSCQGCQKCLSLVLTRDSLHRLNSCGKADAVISCGSSLAALNLIVSRDNLAKSIVITRPSVLSMRRFDLAIIPEHDNPPKWENVAVTQGALNLIDEEYLKEQGEKLISSVLHSRPKSAIGLLLGGDTKDFRLNKQDMVLMVQQLKLAAEKFDAEILASTSRRTPREAESFLKNELAGHVRCKLLVIANDRNIPEAVGGILSLSKIIVCSPESISMISEAVRSRNYVLVFDVPGLSRKHRRFLDHFASRKYIYLVRIPEIQKQAEYLLIHNPPVHFPEDERIVAEALKKIL